MWEELFPDPMSLIAADNKLIMLGLGGVLRVADVSSSSYSELSSIDVGKDLPYSNFASPPVLYKGRIYCRNRPGELICVDVEG